MTRPTSFRHKGACLALLGACAIFAAERTSYVDAAAAPVLAQESKVTNIDIGRQLFVDDFLIKESTLTRNFHQAKLYQDAPILKAETRLERESGTAEARSCSTAASGSIPKIRCSRCGTPAVSATAFATPPARMNPLGPPATRRISR